MELLCWRFCQSNGFCSKLWSYALLDPEKTGQLVIARLMAGHGDSETRAIFFRERDCALKRLIMSATR